MPTHDGKIESNSSSCTSCRFLISLSMGERPFFAKARAMNHPDSQANGDMLLLQYVALRNRNSLCGNSIKLIENRLLRPNLIPRSASKRLGVCGTHLRIRRNPIKRLEYKSRRLAKPPQDKRTLQELYSRKQEGGGGPRRREFAASLLRFLDKP